MNTMTLKILVVPLVLGGCLGTPLKDYTPMSRQEAEIKNVLLKYEDCWNRKDTACIGALFTEDAQIMIGGRKKRVLSVNKVPKDLLPWIIDKVGTKRYMISKIEITGDQAHVISFVTISHIPSSWLEQDLFLVFRGGKWLIKKQSHGTHLEDSPHAHVDRR